MDTTLLNLLADWQSPALTALMAAVTWLGSVFILLPLSILLGKQFAGAVALTDWRRWGFIPVAVASAAGLAQLLKIVTERARPDLFPSLVPMPADFSFPSAHSMQVTAFVLAWLCCLNKRRLLWPAIAGISLIVTVGFSRLYLQVHFPSDVFAGILLGALWVMALRALAIWHLPAK